MNWKQKFEELFPKNEYVKIFSSAEGLLNLGDYKTNAESQVKAGNIENARNRIIENVPNYILYKKAYSLYKMYPGPKKTFQPGSCWSDFKIHFDKEGVLNFPVPNIPLNLYFLRVERLLRDYERRLAKHPRNRECCVK